MAKAAAKAASKITPKDDEQVEKTDATEKDSPLLDLSDAAVKKLIKAAKVRGYVTFDALNAVLPQEQTTSEQIEDIMSMLSDMGITVVDNEEAEEGAAPAEVDEPAEEEERSVTAQRDRKSTRLNSSHRH